MGGLCNSQVVVDVQVVHKVGMIEVGATNSHGDVMLELVLCKITSTMAKGCTYGMPAANLDCRLEICRPSIGHYRLISAVIRSRQCWEQPA